VLKVLVTNGCISGFIVSREHRHEVLLRSFIFFGKAWEFDSNLSRPKVNALNFAVHNLGAAQVRVYESTNAPNQTVFHFPNMCDQNTDYAACTLEWLEVNGYVQQFTSPHPVASCHECNLFGHNRRSLRCPRHASKLNADTFS
jgi:hypothetical protein